MRQEVGEVLRHAEQPVVQVGSLLMNSGSLAGRVVKELIIVQQTGDRPTANPDGTTVIHSDTPKLKLSAKSVSGVIMGPLPRWLEVTPFPAENHEEPPLSAAEQRNAYMAAIAKGQTKEYNFADRLRRGELDAWRDDEALSSLPRIGALREARRITENGGFLLTGNTTDLERSLAINLGYQVIATASYAEFNLGSLLHIGETLLKLQGEPTTAGAVVDLMS